MTRGFWGIGLGVEVETLLKVSCLYLWMVGWKDG